MPYDTARQWPEDPHALFESWLAEAAQSEPNDPNAMCLATVAADGMPSARMVLLKAHDRRGFVFYTNSDSRKGQELHEHMNAALCFHWKSLQKQVRVTGKVELVDATDADAYYNSRARASRIGAWASDQSRPLDKRETFDQRVAEFEQTFRDTDTIPRPPYWNGYRVLPREIEFWINQEFRLHRRCVYKTEGTGWHRQMLFP